MRNFTRAVIIGVCAVLALTGVQAAAHAQPSVNNGECFNLTNKQIAAESFPGVASVDCSSRHTVEIVTSGVAPTGTKNVKAWAASYCSYSRVARTYGKNTRKNGVMNNPFRLNNLYFIDGNQFICAASIFRMDNGKYSNETLTGPLAQLLSNDPGLFGICYAFIEGSGPTGKHASTVSCNQGEPHWVNYRTIDLAMAHKKMPSRDTIVALAHKYCHNFDDATFPLPNEWPRYHYLNCYKIG